MKAPRPLPKPASDLAEREAKARSISPAAVRCEVACRARANRRLLNIMSALATGWLPWGVSWQADIVRVGNRWMLCCGHALSFAEASRFVASDLLTEAQRPDGTPTLIITDAGRVWLAQHWPVR